MSNRVFWLRLSYWLGAVVDFLMAVAMSFPGLFFKLLGQSALLTNEPLQYALRLGAALMFGWTLLLLWADREPVERREVLLLTIFVILGVALTTVFGVRARLISLESGLLTWFSQLVVVALFWHSYSLTGQSSLASTETDL